MALEAKLAVLKLHPIRFRLEGRDKISLRGKSRVFLMAILPREASAAHGGRKLVPG